MKREQYSWLSVINVISDPHSEARKSAKIISSQCGDCLLRVAACSRMCSVTTYDRYCQDVQASFLFG